MAVPPPPGALVCNSNCFSEQLFYGNYWTVDSPHKHCNFSRVLSTRQDGVENRDRVYYPYLSVATTTTGYSIKPSSFHLQVCVY